MVLQLGNPRGERAESSASGSRPGSPSGSGRPLRPHQARQKWEEFGGDRSKKNKKREPRTTVWSTYARPNLRPEDPTLMETILRDLAEKERSQSSPSARGWSRPSSAPDQHFSEAPLLASPSTPAALLRPQSAPTIGVSPRVARQRPGSSSRPRQPRLLRPQSAPRLLDGSGLLEKRPHTSPFLQRMEDLAVRETLNRFKSNALSEKMAVAHIDVMHDYSLSDLKVLHNPTARKRTEKMRCESPPRFAESSKLRDGRGQAPGVHRIGPRHPKWRELPAVDQMRNLCHVMDMDLRLHGPTTKETTQADNESDIEASVDLTQEAVEPVSPSKNLFAGLESGVKFGEMNNINRQRQRTANFVNNSNAEMIRITVNLLDFLLDKCSTLVEFVRVLNISRQSAQDNSTRTQVEGFLHSPKHTKVTRRDWETALMALGYISDDPSRFFRAVDSENAGELMCEELVDALEALCPNLIERRLSHPRATTQGAATSPSKVSQASYVKTHVKVPDADILEDESSIASGSESEPSEMS